MIKLPCSIGQYTLRDIHFMSGREGSGYRANIAKGTKVYGVIEDWGGGGGPNARIFPFEDASVRQQLKEIAQNSVADFLTIYSEIGGNSSSLMSGGPNTNEYEAMCNMGELLIELSEMVRKGKAVKKANPLSDIVVFSTGTGWISDRLFEKGTLYSVPLPPGSEDTQLKALKKMVGTQLKSQGLSTYVNKLRILKADSSATWSLSISEYAAMYKKAEKFNNL